MDSLADADLRLNLAQGHVLEAEEDLGIGQWREAADAAQLCAENAGKAVLALHDPVPRTHDPHEQLFPLAETLPPGEQRDMVLRIAGIVREMGSKLHAEVRYGDERARLTPWQLFDEARARALVARAGQALDLARRLVELRKGQA